MDDDELKRLQNIGVSAREQLVIDALEHGRRITLQDIQMAGVEAMEQEVIRGLDKMPFFKFVPYSQIRDPALLQFGPRPKLGKLIQFRPPVEKKDGLEGMIAPDSFEEE